MQVILIGEREVFCERGLRPSQWDYSPFGWTGAYMRGKQRMRRGGRVGIDNNEGGEGWIPSQAGNDVFISWE